MFFILKLIQLYVFAILFKNNSEIKMCFWEGWGEEKRWQKEAAVHSIVLY